MAEYPARERNLDHGVHLCFELKGSRRGLPRRSWSLVRCCYSEDASTAEADGRPFRGSRHAFLMIWKPTLGSSYTEQLIRGVFIESFLDQSVQTVAKQKTVSSAMLYDHLWRFIYSEPYACIRAAFCRLFILLGSSTSGKKQIDRCFNESRVQILHEAILVSAKTQTQARARCLATSMK